MLRSWGHCPREKDERDREREREEREARERWMKGHVVKFRAAHLRVWGQQKHGAECAKALAQWEKK